jgi:protein-L-isoaspartate(D-aspartate) O-methyltransferase
MVDRSAFIPDTIWVDDGEGFLVPLHRGDDPDRWSALCASDEAIVIQVDDGASQVRRGVRPTSSSSAPPLMSAMLDRLRLGGSQTVLEIGTGTGFNAALLAERVGATNVTTIECDPTLAEHARTRLARAGLAGVTVVTGDGGKGYPPRAPFDRIIATAAVHEIPYAWVEQTRPGGLIVAPFTPTLAGGRLAVLTARDGVATGHFADTVAFMYLRQQRPVPVWWGDDEARADYTEHVSDRAPAAEVFDDPTAAFGVGLLMPGCVQGRTIGTDGTPTLRVCDSASASWASCTEVGAGYRIRQHGPRPLWADLEASHALWSAAGRPEHTRFHITVTSGGQDVGIE